MMPLGFIGLGKMGRPMTVNLLRAGYPVTVHNRSRGVVDELAREGARPAGSPAEVARASQLVFTCLPTPEAVETVVLGPQGILEAGVPDLIVVDCSTVNPELSRRLHTAAAERGAGFLDAPVSGGPPGAESATLTIMVGGDEAVYDRALPALRTVGVNVHYAGPSGSGSVVKIVNQLLTAVNTAAVAEAVVLGSRAGVAADVLYEVIRTSYGGSRMFERAMPRIMERDFEPGGPIELLLKDLEIIHDVGRDLNVRLLLSAVVQELFKEGRALGFGAEDMAAVVKPLERIAGVEVRGRGATGERI
jgi:3-hydroxyisobutyrate dehydrogenase/2-hydroxy-3-oxopropionate reductase